MSEGAGILRDTTKILSGEVGKSKGREYRPEEATDLLRVQDQLPVGRSHEEPCKKRPQGTQTGRNEGGAKQELWKRHRDNMPHLQEKLYKSKNDEAAHEDSTRDDPRVTNMQRMRQEVPNQVGT